MGVDRTAKEKAWDEGVAFGWKSASGLIQTHRDMQEKATRRAEELVVENARLRRLLMDGPATPQECAEICKAAREDGDGKPCIDCEPARFTLA